MIYCACQWTGFYVIGTSVMKELKPTFKIGTRTDPKNYRPISLLPLVSKTIEKSIHFQIEDNLNKKKLIYLSQSGFSTNHSKDFFLAHLIDFDWYG